jgi:serine/threonine-protein kinase
MPEPAAEPAVTAAPASDPAAAAAPDSDPAVAAAPDSDLAATAAPDSDPAAATAPASDPSAAAAPDSDPAATAAARSAVRLVRSWFRPAAPAAPRPSPQLIGEWARGFAQPADASSMPVTVADRARDALARLRSVAMLVGLAAVAFAVGLVLFNNLVMPRLIHGVGQVTVPDLTNLTFEQAEHALRPFGLQASRSGERFDPAVPRGFVLAQEPEAGSTVRGRKRIAVVVSLGEEFSSVPELFGESVRSARMLIERAGLRSGSVVMAPSEETGEGLVAASDPGPETVLQRNTPVHLLVSTGAGTEDFVMPDLVGREIAGVRRQLEALGFRVERSGAGTSVGSIVAQRPPPGSRITRADVIQLTASGRIIR